jgi:hypothetical protein
MFHSPLNFSQLKLRRPMPGSPTIPLLVSGLLFAHRHRCVICLDKPVTSETDPNVVAAYRSKDGTVLGDDPQPYVNPNLPFGLITRTRAADQGKSNVHIGRAFYGDVDVDPNVHLDFHEFELLVNSATIVDTAASGTTGGGKGANPKVLALPVSPNGFLLK